MEANVREEYPLPFYNKAVVVEPDLVGKCGRRGVKVGWLDLGVANSDRVGGMR